MRRALAAVVLGGALGGCANLAPSATTTSKLAQAQATHEYPAPPPRRERIAGEGSPSAIAAIRAFATAYINWNAQTVARDMLTLAAESVGQARSATELAASQTAGDYELRRGGVANSGSVEALAPLPGGGRYVVVTLERTTATNTTAYEGLVPAWHITIATVQQLTPNRWVVSGWQPES